METLEKISSDKIAAEINKTSKSIKCISKNLKKSRGVDAFKLKVILAVRVAYLESLLKTANKIINENRKNVFLKCIERNLQLNN